MSVSIESMERARSSITLYLLISPRGSLFVFSFAKRVVSLETFLIGLITYLLMNTATMMLIAATIVSTLMTIRIKYGEKAFAISLNGRCTQSSAVTSPSEFSIGTRVVI